MTSATGDEWWYCLRHKQVEQGVGCRGADRMGPYPSEAAAQQALATAAQRTEAWDEDPKWRDDDA